MLTFYKATQMPVCLYCIIDRKQLMFRKQTKKYEEDIASQEDSMSVCPASGSKGQRQRVITRTLALGVAFNFLGLFSTYAVE